MRSLAPALRWLALGVTPLLAGCITTALYVTNRPSQSVLNEMKRQCERDANTHWYGDKPKGAEFWVAGFVQQDPKVARADDAKPYAEFWNTDEPWLRSGLARALLIHIDPQRAPTQTTYFGPAKMFLGPAQGEPAGLYRFELLPASDARCRPYQELQAIISKMNPNYRPDPQERCIAYSYVGPWQGVRGDHVILRFDDAEAAKRGFSRSGEALLVGGSVRAQRTNYSAVSPNGSSEHRGWWGVEACKPIVGNLADGHGLSAER